MDDARSGGFYAAVADPRAFTVEHHIHIKYVPVARGFYVQCPRCHQGDHDIWLDWRGWKQSGPGDVVCENCLAIYQVTGMTESIDHAYRAEGAVTMVEAGSLVDIVDKALLDMVV